MERNYLNKKAKGAAHFVMGIFGDSGPDGRPTALEGSVDEVRKRIIRTGVNNVEPIYLNGKGDRAGVIFWGMGAPPLRLHAVDFENGPSDLGIGFLGMPFLHNNDYEKVSPPLSAPDRKWCIT